MHSQSWLSGPYGAAGDARNLIGSLNLFAEPRRRERGRRQVGLVWSKYLGQLAIEYVRRSMTAGDVAKKAGGGDISGRGSRSGRQGRVAAAPEPAPSLACEQRKTTMGARGRRVAKLKQAS